MQLQWQGLAHVCCVAASRRHPITIYTGALLSSWQVHFYLGTAYVALKDVQMPPPQPAAGASGETKLSVLGLCHKFRCG